MPLAIGPQIRAEMPALQLITMAPTCVPSSSGKRPSLPLYLANASAMYTVYDVNRSMTPCRRKRKPTKVQVQDVQCLVKDTDHSTPLQGLQQRVPAMIQEVSMLPIADGTHLAQGGGDAGAAQRRKAAHAEVDLVQHVVRRLEGRHELAPPRLAPGLRQALQSERGRSALYALRTLNPP
jgi:hypothetical protein